jgi:hypothetical protein
VPLAKAGHQLLLPLAALPHLHQHLQPHPGLHPLQKRAVRLWAAVTVVLSVLLVYQLLRYHLRYGLRL